MPRPIERWNDAVAFVLRHHGDALRKGTRVPYVTHVMAVAETLAYRYPERDELVLAGLLHDVVEDTSACFDDVARAFGPRVAALVRAVSKDDEAMAAWDGRSLPRDPMGEVERRDVWFRRRRYLLHLITGRQVGPDVLRLKAADAHANLRTILRDLRNPELGAAVWDRFNVAREESLWFYGSVAVAVERGIGAEPLVEELQQVLREVTASSDGTSPAGTAPTGDEQA